MLCFANSKEFYFGIHVYLTKPYTAAHRSSLQNGAVHTPERHNKLMAINTKWARGRAFSRTFDGTLGFPFSAHKTREYKAQQSESSHSLKGALEIQAEEQHYVVRITH